MMVVGYAPSVEDSQQFKLVPAERSIAGRKLLASGGIHARAELHSLIADVINTQTGCCNLDLSLPCRNVKVSENKPSAFIATEI